MCLKLCPLPLSNRCQKNAHGSLVECQLTARRNDYIHEKNCCLTVTLSTQTRHWQPWERSQAYAVIKLEYNTPCVPNTARHFTDPRAKSKKHLNELLSISIRSLRHKISSQYTIILFVLSFYDAVRPKGYIASNSWHQTFQSGAIWILRVV
jgi:hypothetical protein